MHPVTYCTNIHPGESWDEAKSALASHTLAVKAALSPNAPFPVGLRVSGQALQEIDAPEAARFKDWLAENGLTVATVNGFPYGRFHAVPVKADVYQPDWRDPKRLAYTNGLADLLALWLPDGRTGSISSVPLGFRQGFDPSQVDLATGRIVAALEHLDALAQKTGRFIRLSLEPEPGCMLETTPQVVEFFSRLNLPTRLAPYLAVCYDCCHQALQFEDPRESLAMLAANAIPIGHVQVSSALHLESACLDSLARFDEPVYLHQAVGRRAATPAQDVLGDGPAPGHSNRPGTRNGAFDVFRDGVSLHDSQAQGQPARLIRHDDLGPALAAGDAGVESWRVHFHLPVFLDALPECRTTQEFLRRALPLFDPDIPMEVETYTWSVLPPDLQTPTVVESIVREIRWVEACRRREALPEA